MFKNLIHSDCFSKLKAAPHIWIGLSGGVDSVVLLHYFASIPEIAKKLKVIHVNHGLSIHANDWENFCIDFAKQLNIDHRVVKLGLNLNSNIEEQARNARYTAFQSIIQKGDALLLAHHLDDLLETFLLNSIRGTGLLGLAAMPRWRQWEGIAIFRPFLEIPRSSILAYAATHQLPWVSDESNESTVYARNFLRHEIFPQIEKKWPHYRQSMLHTILACQDTYDYLEDHVSDFIPTEKLMNKHLDTTLLKSLSHEQIFLILRKWFYVQGLKPPGNKVLQQVIDQMIFPSRKDTMPQIKWNKINLFYYQESIYYHPEMDKKSLELWKSFPDAFKGFSAKVSYDGVTIDPKHDRVEIRYRQGGEVIFYKGHHRELKKLFQSAKVPAFMRNQIPLIYVNNELKVVVGYWYADNLETQKPKYQIHYQNN